MRHRASLSWPARVLRSGAFASLISVVLHAAVFAGLYVMVFREGDASRRVIIPEARLAPDAVPTELSPTDPLELTDKPTTEVEPLAVPELSRMPMVSVSLAGPPDLMLPTLTRVSADASLASAALGSPVGGGPATRFFGQVGNAYEVAYVVDLSASVMLYFPDIVAEMQDSIRALMPTQKFAIVLAKPGREVVAFRDGRLTRATRRNKEEAKSFLASQIKRGGGPADAVTAMERALSADPELVYFLSDGVYGAVYQESLMASLDRVNRDRSAKITVIGFGPPPYKTKGMMNPPQLLKHIAETHGGNYHEVQLDP